MLVLSLDFGFGSRSESKSEGVGNTTFQEATGDSNDVHFARELGIEAAPTSTLLQGSSVPDIELEEDIQGNVSNSCTVIPFSSTYGTIGCIMVTSL